MRDLRWPYSNVTLTRIFVPDEIQAEIDAVRKARRPARARRR